MAKKAYIGADNFTRRELPSGYTQVLYIESSGTQYIDTGFTPNQDTRVVADFELTASDATAFPFCGRTASNKNAFGLYWYTNSKFYAIYGSAQYAFSTTEGAARHSCDLNKNVATINGETYTFTQETFTSTVTMAMFARNSGGTITKYPSIRMYSCRIYDNGTLIRDYVPCLNASGTAGLYDMANGVFYGNAGTGSFTVGAVYASGVARKIKRDYIGIDDVARRVKKAYIGIGGVARPWQVSDEVVYYGSIAGLSKGRTGLAGAMIDNYALFAGGYGGPDEDGDYIYYNTVDAYDASLTRRTAGDLNYGVTTPAATTLGGRALIGGGVCFWWDGDVFNNYYVDAYDKSLTRSSAPNLGTGRGGLSATTVGNYALFAGGTEFTEYEDEDDDYRSDVDAYNSSLTKVAVSNLSDEVHSPAATTVGNYALIGGGQLFYGGKTPMDAYDASLTKTSLARLPEYAYVYVAATVGDYAVFFGNNKIFAYDKSLTLTEVSNGAFGGYPVAATSLQSFALFGGGAPFRIVSVDKSLTVSLVKRFDESRGGPGAATVGDFALFAGGYKYESIYDAEYFLKYVEAFQYSKGE